MENQRFCSWIQYVLPSWKLYSQHELLLTLFTHEYKMCCRFLFTQVRVEGSSFDLPGFNFVRGALEAFRSKVLATAGSRHRRDPSRTRLCSRQRPQTPSFPVWFPITREGWMFRFAK